MSKQTASDCSPVVNSSLVVSLDFLTALANTTTPDDLFHAIAEWLPRILPADRISIALGNSDNMLGVVAVSGDRIKFDAQLIPIKGSNDAHHSDADDTLALLTTTGAQALQVLAVENNLINQRVIELIMLRAGH
jgi:hypothetical protein